MGKSKKPRKAYRPKPVWVNLMAVVRENAAVLDRAEVARISAVLHQAFDLFRRGERPEVQADIMADALKVAESIAELGVCSDDESVAAILGAQGALAAAADRVAAGGTWTMRADELAVLDAGVLRHIIQLEYVARSEYDEAIRRTRVRLSAALRGQGTRRLVVMAGGFARQASQTVALARDNKTAETRDTRPQNAGQFG